MKRLAITAAAASAIAIFALATPAFAEAPKFTANCPTGLAIKSNGKGKIRINGAKATVKTFSPSAWEASNSGVTIDISLEGAGLAVSYSAKGGAHGICQVTSYEAAGSGGATDYSGVPAKDDQACLAAVSRETNNGTVTILGHKSSEANNTVIVGVGPQKAKWQCLVKNGKVAGVMSLTDEGAM